MRGVIDQDIDVAECCSARSKRYFRSLRGERERSCGADPLICARDKNDPYTLVQRRPRSRCREGREMLPLAYPDAKAY